MRAIAAYFPATLMAYLLASAFSTVMIMAGLMYMAMPVSATDVLAAVWFDWLGLLGSYLPLVAIALLVALPVAGQLHRRLGLPRRFIYALAGFVALIAIHLILEATLGLIGFAAVRSVFGLLMQGVAGGVAGWFFAHLSQVKV